MEISSWQQDLQNAIRDPLELLERVGLDGHAVSLPENSLQQFPVRVPAGFADRIQKHRRDDPLLRQILPLAEEDVSVPGFLHDPLRELDRQPAPGLLKKYHGRVLLVTTGICAIHCRYCFRRHFPYADNNPLRDNWRPALDFIRADASINEVILSGGDPLALSDERLASLVEGLRAIPHLKRVRIHSRLPVVLPNRVSAALLALLRSQPLQTILVIHANHANEISAEVKRGLLELHQAGVTLFNQSVLLHGVNDHADALQELSETLFDGRVLPYYLHQLDPVAGAAHFQVDERRARDIMEQLRTRLPGYLVPRLVREQAGAPYKMPVL